MKKNNFVWLLILCCFSYYYYYLIDNDLIGLFIHPKMFVYSYFAFGVFILFILIQIYRLFREKGEKSFRFGYLIFFIPIVIVVSLNPNTLSNNNIPNNSDDLITGGIYCPLEAKNKKIIIIEDYDKSTELKSSKTNEQTVYVAEEINKIDDSVSAITNVTENEIYEEDKIDITEVKDNNIIKVEEKEEKIELAEEKPNENINEILFDEGFTTEAEQHMEIIRLSYEESEKLESKDVTLIGFVNNIDFLNDNQFYLGRIIITCCIFCAQPDGFICVCEIPQDIEDNQWVSIRGTFHLNKYKSPYYEEELELQFLYVKKIDFANEPKDPYLYYK